jgi:hypothetical protein
VPTSISQQHTSVSFDIDTFFTDLLVPSFSIMTSQNTNDILAGIETRLIDFSALNIASTHKIIVGIDYGTTFSGMQVVFCLKTSHH